MKLTLGFSPCPNDTFIFDAIVNGKIDTEGIDFEYYLADIEELNRKAFTGKPDITKISSFAYAFAAGNYMILDSGSALGFKNGPLLVSRGKIDNASLATARIAIPGRYTTANMLFSIAWPEAANKTEYLFSEIENAVLNGEADAGLIIHEGRFTYKKKGLQKIADLGEFWEGMTGLPVPLGMIVINRSIPGETALAVNRIIHRSIGFALRDPAASQEFVSGNAREMERDVVHKHIELYVNKFTVNLGHEGREAVTRLYRIASDKGIIPAIPDQLFAGV